MSSYPPEWRERIPARVFGCLRDGELRITVLPGVGMVDGGVPYDVPTSVIPFDLRMPNTDLWIRCDESMNIVEAWRRDAD